MVQAQPDSNTGLPPSYPKLDRELSLFDEERRPIENDLHLLEPGAGERSVRMSLKSRALPRISRRPGTDSS